MASYRSSAGYLLVFFAITSLLSRPSSADLTFELPEESDVDYLVGSIAEGLEVDSDPEIHYQFASILSPNQTFFDLDPENGDLRTVRIIDREEECPDQELDSFCQKTIQVLIRRGDQVNVTNVYVNILDINDHTPLFSDNVINLAISESVVPGTRFPMELASDPDVGDNTVQEYRLSDDYDGLFELSVIQFRDGTILSVSLEVAGPLDRETRPSYAFYLEASDHGVPRKVGSALLNVTVLDSNDNSPSFLQSEYSVDIPEDWTIGNSILTVQATDDDSGSNGRVVYSFAPSVLSSTRELFEIDRDTGVIKTTGRLDFESKQRFQLVVAASNDVDNPVPDFAYVAINIIDVNDNRPVLTVTPLDGEGRRANLSEMSPPGTHVAFITVSDVDTGVNGQVTVSLMFHFDNFTLVQERPGQYFVKTLTYLDREEIPIFNITVMARDHGNPAKFSRRKLVVFVEDINDNYPFFIESPIRASINENNRPDDTVTAIIAFDDDEGLNSNLIFTMFGGEEFFFINPITGILRANKRFDRENISSIAFVVEACDQGVPVLCTNSSMNVTVKDMNDNPPIFQKELYEFHLLENNQIADVIGTVRATDIDSGNNSRIAYTLAHQKFLIEPLFGTIYATEMLDFEEQESYSFIVTATDGGKPTQTGVTRVVITLSDENDNSPRILFPNENDDIRFIPVKAEPGFFVAEVNSYDPDSNHNAMLSYEIESGNVGGYFGISSSGIIVTAKAFADMKEQVFNLSIRVTDGGRQPLSKLADLHVAVANKEFNESLPASNFTERFNRTIYNFHLSKLPSTDQLMVTDWLMVIVISLAGLAIILLVVFLILASTRCRNSDSQKEHHRQYSVPTGNEKLYVASLTRSVATDSDSGHPDHSIITSHSSIPSKNIMKWRQQAQQHARRNDLRIGHPRMSTFGSNSDISNVSMNSRQMTDPDAEVQRLIDKLRLSPTDMTSDHSSEGDARSSSRDSGNGCDSDRDTRDASTSTIPRTAPSAFTAQRASPAHSKRSSSMPMIATGAPNMNSPLEPPRNFSPGTRCTPECLTIGHGDHCWLPSGTHSVPKSKSVTFLHPVEGDFSTRDRNDNRLADRTADPGQQPRLQAAALLDRLRQSPTPSSAESTQSDPGRYPTEDPRRHANAVHLSPIREHPDERRNRKRHPNKRRTSGERGGSNPRGSKLRGNLSARIRDPGTYPMHSKAPPPNDDCEGVGSPESPVDAIRPPAPYLDDTDSDNEYVNTDQGASTTVEELDGTMRDWV